MGKLPKLADVGRDRDRLIGLAHAAGEDALAVRIDHYFAMLDAGREANRRAAQRRRERIRADPVRQAREVAKRRERAYARDADEFQASLGAQHERADTDVSDLV